MSTCFVPSFSKIIVCGIQPERAAKISSLFMVLIGIFFLQGSIQERKDFGFALNILGIMQGFVLYFGIKTQITSVVACCWFSQGLYCAFGTYYTFGKAVSFGKMVFIGDVLCYVAYVYFTLVVFVYLRHLWQHARGGLIFFNNNNNNERNPLMFMDGDDVGGRRRNPSHHTYETIQTSTATGAVSSVAANDSVSVVQGGRLGDSQRVQGVVHNNNQRNTVRMHFARDLSNPVTENVNEVYYV